jgi:hypothetical protein
LSDGGQGGLIDIDNAHRQVCRGRSRPDLLIGVEGRLARDPHRVRVRGAQQYQPHDDGSAEQQG